MRYIFLDLETTGLDPDVDEITEAAWIVADGPFVAERQMFVEHVRLPGQWTLTKTDYLTRIAPAQKISRERLKLELAADCIFATSPAYLVGANPAFDHAFLRRLFYPRGVPYNFHLIDIETVVMGAFGLPKPPRLFELRGIVGVAGENPAPHSALADALEVKVIWDALEALKVTA